MDGEWSPPKINNPEYKGEWKPKQIGKNQDEKNLFLRGKIKQL